MFEASLIKACLTASGSVSHKLSDNMKLLILAALVVLANADVSHILAKGGKDERQAAILKQELDVDPAGGYQWGFESDNGIKISAKGEIPNPNVENPGQITQGEASWTAPDGEQISLQYIADENGYQPQGSHLPTPPPIPEAIIRALEYIRAHPAPPEKN